MTLPERMQWQRRVLALYREIGTKSGEAYVVPLLGEITFYQGDTTTARLLFEKTCAFYREVGNEAQIAWTLSLLGEGHRCPGRPGGGTSFLRREPEPREGSEQQSSLSWIFLLLLKAWQPWSQHRGNQRGRHVSGVRRKPSAKPTVYPCRRSIVPTTSKQLLPPAPNWMSNPSRQRGLEGRSMTPEQALAARGAVTVPVQPQATGSVKSLLTYPDGLTAREVEVLCLVAQGMSNAEIAEQLIISLLTVKAHMRSLYNKLGISSRSAATRYAIEHHLL